MKKMINLSAIYLGLGLACGVFYREYTKYMHFTGKTSLGVMHTHFLVLGTFLFLILAIYANQTDLLQDIAFYKFLKIYNFSLPFMVTTMLIRGITQVHAMELSKMIDYSISGLAGISHVLMLIAFIYLYKALKNLCYEIEGE